MRVPPLGAGVDEGSACHLLERLKLYPGEDVLAVAHASVRRPIAVHVAVTTMRLLALDAAAQLGPRKAVRLDRTAEVAWEARRAGAAKLSATTRHGRTVEFGTLRTADVPLIGAVLDRVRAVSPAAPPSGAPEVFSRDDEIRAGRRREWCGVAFLGGRPNDVVVRHILSHGRPGERPWLVLVGAGGTLVAWSDRLTVVRTGTAEPAGRSSGGPVCALDFAEISDLEYHADGSVLVVHSPRLGRYVVDTDGRHASPNVVPVERSVYLAAQPHLAVLHRLVTSSRPA